MFTEKKSTVTTLDAKGRSQGRPVEITRHSFGIISFSGEFGQLVMSGANEIGFKTLRETLEAAARVTWFRLRLKTDATGRFVRRYGRSAAGNEQRG